MEAPNAFDAPPHKLWTRHECASLEKAGVLDMERYELIAGELVLKMGKNYPHILAQALLAAWLQRVFGALFVLQQPTIDVHPEDTPTSEPEPDVVVLTRPIPELAHRPRPADLRLVAEVSNSTLSFDLTVKASLYARAAIPEYWVLDLDARRVIVHRQPLDGRYQEIAAYLHDESVATLAAPGSPIRVADLL